MRQRAVTFGCGGEWLVGVVSLPDKPCRRGVLLVVGGPQYRAGSHRQFVLLANALADAGVAVLRFDYRGMGDSTGALRTFEQIDGDIAAAVDAFFEAASGLQDVVIWGLCDAATAAAFYAHRDSRIRGLVLLNPWVRSADSEAKAYLRHYYWQRLSTPDCWRRLLRGEMRILSSARDLAGNVLKALGRDAGHTAVGEASSSPRARGTLAERMAYGLERFRGPVLLVLSGNDLTAQEFVDVSASSNAWRELFSAPRITRRELPEATHTFSRRAWRDTVTRWTAQWVRSW